MKLRGKFKNFEIFPVVFSKKSKFFFSVEKIHFRAVTALEGSTHPTRTPRGAPAPPPATPSTANRYKGVHASIMGRRGLGHCPDNNPGIRGVPLCGKFGNAPFFLARPRWSKFSPLPAVAAALLLGIPLVKNTRGPVLAVLKIPIIQNARIVEQNCDLGRFKL
jgi:hypothetical protein